MPTQLPYLPQQIPNLSQSTRGDIIELIFAGHALAKLHTRDGRCLCGELTGPADQPRSHVTYLCPIARYYQAVNDLTEVQL